MGLLPIEGRGLLVYIGDKTGSAAGEARRRVRNMDRIKPPVICEKYAHASDNAVYAHAFGIAPVRVHGGYEHREHLQPVTSNPIIRPEPSGNHSVLYIIGRRR